MDAVYLLWHHPNGVDSDQNVLLVGVYRTENTARQAITRLSGKPGFVQVPGSFEINKYELDHDHWTDGFRIET